MVLDCKQHNKLIEIIKSKGISKRNLHFKTESCNTSHQEHSCEVTCTGNTKIIYNVTFTTNYNIALYVQKNIRVRKKFPFVLLNNCFSF